MSVLEALDERAYIELENLVTDAVEAEDWEMMRHLTKEYIFKLLHELELHRLAEVYHKSG